MGLLCMRSYYVYIMTNDWNTVFYTGVTNNLGGRVRQHKRKTNESSFTAQYQIHKLVFYEEYENAYDAILREKQLKNWKRDWKLSLIKKQNPQLRDLSADWFGDSGSSPE